jgi:hypothetical protein
MTLREQQILLRQMSQRTGFRLLNAYSVALGIGGLAALSFMDRTGRRSAIGHFWLDAHSVSNAFTRYAVEIVLAVTAIGGAIIVRSPLPGTTAALLGDFARRFRGPLNACFTVRPAHGAWLLARVALIVPLFLAIGFLISVRRFDVMTRSLGSLVSFAVAVSIVACVCGALAAWLSSKSLRWPVSTWWAIWVVPEIVRLIAPDTPTCHSMFTWLLLSAAGSWGSH